MTITQMSGGNGSFISHSITIRKIDLKQDGSRKQLPKEHLQRQSLTLHRKLKRKINGLISEVVVERDSVGTGYHIHMMVHHDDYTTLKQVLSKFIGSGNWFTKSNEYETYDCIKGSYGEVQIHEVYYIRGFRNYLNKTGMTRTLV